ncbi:MAG: sigma-70 family RNA polymerase sigma factor [Draconibacterium sp.]
MSSKMGHSDKLILNELKKHNEKVFETVFDEFHQPLLKFAEHVVFNRDVCEDIVQSVFISLWENAGSIEIQKSLKSWLYQAVRYKGLTYLRNLNIKDKHKLIYLEHEISEMKESEMYDTSELTKKINTAIESLPAEMQKIFRLKYLDELKVKDTKIASDGKRLEYHAEKKKETKKAEIIYNTLKVPRGGQFFLILSDSTRVWLNSESELRYPVTFPNEKREVTLIGEAYFEVTKNIKQPFIVHSEKQQIEVLGTSFNVTAYRNNEFIRTTLIEGRVKVSSTDYETYLEPSYQALVNSQNGHTTKQLVKTELYTIWKD